MEFLSAEWDGAFWAFLLMITGLEGEQIQNKCRWLFLLVNAWLYAGQVLGFLCCSSCVLCPYCSCWVWSRCENSVSFLPTHGVQCLINKFPIFWAKYLGKSPLVDARICNNLQPPHEPYVEWHTLCKDVVSFIVLAPASTPWAFSGRRVDFHIGTLRLSGKQWL